MNGTPADFTNWGDALNVVRLIGLLIPIATAALTKYRAPSSVKSVVTLVLSVLTGTIATIAATDGGWDFSGFLNNFINAFVPAIAAYYGLFKPTDVTGKVGRATANLGVGGNRSHSRAHPDTV